MRLLTAVIVACLSSPLLAVPEIVQAPGWRITLDAPPIKDRVVEKGPDSLSYQANSGRFNVSIFVEKQAKPGGNQECFEHFWALASANPLIRKPTVKTSHSDTYHRVEYLVATDIRGEAVTQQNVNYYFMFDGKWVDIHVSIINPTPEDAAIIAAFDKGLVYGK